MQEATTAILDGITQNGRCQATSSQGLARAKKMMVKIGSFGVGLGVASTNGWRRNQSHAERYNVVILPVGGAPDVIGSCLDRQDSMYPYMGGVHNFCENTIGHHRLRS